VQVHFSWLFFPFHRAYLYFFERVAAKLLDDPGFVLPVWTWDIPEGMRIPEAFADAASPLYDPIREPAHAPPKVADLDFFRGGEKNLTDEQQIQHNLRVMYKQVQCPLVYPDFSCYSFVADLQ
jgi:polyphenol oxidase